MNTNDLRNTQKNHKYEADHMQIIMDISTYDEELLQWIVNNPSELTNESIMLIGALLAMSDD